MNRLRPKRRARGSVLVTSMILLTVLTAIGVAAVTLASRERINAASKGKLDFAQACANAAAAQIWAEMSAFGLGHLGSNIEVSTKEMVGRNGARIELTAPGHYDQRNQSPVPKVQDLTYKVESTGTSQAAERDCTNRLCGPNDLGRTYSVTAHCRDEFGRESEVELALKFAI